MGPETQQVRKALQALLNPGVEGDRPLLLARRRRRSRNAKCQDVLRTEAGIAGGEPAYAFDDERARNEQRRCQRRGNRAASSFQYDDG